MSDGVALEPLAVRGIFPCIPQAGEGHHATVNEVEGEGDLHLVLLWAEWIAGAPPLVEAGSWDQAAAFLEGLAISTRGGDGLGACVDGGESFEGLQVTSPERILLAKSVTH